MKDIQIRSFSGEDYEQLEILLKSIGWAEQYVAGQMQCIRNLFNVTDGDVVVATRSGKIVGFIQVQHHAWNRMSQLHGLVVSPNCRRQGVARSLVARAEDLAKFRGSRGMYVDTPSNNLVGKSFYMSVGFSIGYVMPEFYEEGLDGITFQRFFPRNIAPEG
jgi:ribosomal protein S18 acetylase RimI-like enzyme